MNKSELQSKKIADLREIAKSVGITNADELKKPEIIDAINGRNKIESSIIILSTHQFLQL